MSAMSNRSSNSSSSSNSDDDIEVDCHGVWCPAEPQMMTWMRIFMRSMHSGDR